MKYLVVGCGLTGAVIARELAERGAQVEIWERRDHIGGNLYDYTDEHGFLVQKYGPHAFHTTKKELYDYICRFARWREYHLTCGAVWDGKYTPTPFNFTTVDTFYPPEEAGRLSEKLRTAFPGREFATVVEVLEHPDGEVRGYAEYLFQKDYAPYTAKQWGVSPEEIDPSVLKRVPLRFSYGEGYFPDQYQVLPETSYTAFFEGLLDHPGISVRLGVEALERLEIRENRLCGVPAESTVVYTGALDELFGCVYGRLPYRSLRFQWRFSREESFQQAPIVAYPQESGYTRITEYKKLPPQKGVGTVCAVEYPVPYREGEQPYYPVLTADSQALYEKYRALAGKVPNLVCCGRLADFKYYNMDQALERALQASGEIIG